MTIKNTTVMIAAFLCVTGCMQPGMDIEVEKEQLREIANAYHEAGSASDVNAVASFYADDGIMLPPNAPERLGIDEIREFANDFTALPGFEMTFDNLRVGVGSNGDLGYTLADTIVAYEGPDGQPIETQLRDFHLWEKRDGEWRLAIDIWNSADEPAGESPLDGAWLVTNLESPDGEVIEPAGPGQFLFQDGHYSAVYTVGVTERRESESAFAPTEREKLEQYDTIIVNSGTYTVDGNTVMMRPLVAKSPEYIGGSSTMKFGLEGNRLTMTIQELKSAGGVSPGDAAGATMTLRRAE